MDRRFNDQKRFFNKIIPLIEELEQEFAKSSVDHFEKLRQDTMARVMGCGVVENIMGEIFNMIYKHVFVERREVGSERITQN